MLFNTVYDNLISILTALSASLPTDDQFIVHPDYYRGYLPTKEDKTHVFLYVGNMQPIINTGSRNFFQYEVEYLFDLLSISAGSKSALGVYTEGDVKASKNLRNLIAFCLDAIFSYSTVNFGLAAGTIKNSVFPRVEPFFPDSATPLERPVVGTRITLKIEMPFEPTLAEGNIGKLIAITGTSQATLDIDPDD